MKLSFVIPAKEGTQRGDHMPLSDAALFIVWLGPRVRGDDELRASG